MDKGLERKLQDLRSRIRKLDCALVAFSGGVDSTLLLRICREELGERAVAVTALSNQYPSAELSLARRIARVMGVKHMTHAIPFSSVSQLKADKSEGQGGPCMGRVYPSLKSLAARMRIKHVLDGSHVDDASEKGFSFMAARRAGIRSPLLESGLSKAEIRLLAKELRLPNWEKPASAFSERKGKNPQKNDRSTRTELKRLESARKYLSSKGLADFALVPRGESLCIITGKKNLLVLAGVMDAVRRRMRLLGFGNVVLALG